MDHSRACYKEYDIICHDVFRPQERANSDFDTGYLSQSFMKLVGEKLERFDVVVFGMGLTEKMKNSCRTWLEKFQTNCRVVERPYSEEDKTEYMAIVRRGSNHEMEAARKEGKGPGWNYKDFCCEVADEIVKNRVSTSVAPPAPNGVQGMCMYDCP